MMYSDQHGSNKTATSAYNASKVPEPRFVTDKLNQLIKLKAGSQQLLILSIHDRINNEANKLT